MNDINKLILSIGNVKGVGNKTISKLVFEEKITEDNFQDFFSWKRLSVCKQLPKRVTEDDWLEAQKRADVILDKCADEHIEVISIFDPLYPSNLKALSNYPMMLFIKGNTEILNTKKSVAIIGTRKPSRAGSKMARAFGRKLGRDGYVVVSGLAIGCDANAHEGALEVDAPTIAILAHGLALPVYPKENRDLAEKILNQGGALVSEYTPTTRLHPSFLVARDAWQSGMSDGVIAVETGISGGTNHALNHAIKNNRPVGMLDFSQLNQEQDVVIGKHQEGNVEYIRTGKVDGLFSKESVEAFEFKMSDKRKERMEKFEQKMTNNRAEDNTEKTFQEKLF